MPPIERALLRTIPWLLVGLVMSLPLIFVSPGDEPMGWFVGQLVALVAFSFGLTSVLLPFGDERWFLEANWGECWRLVASGAGLVALVTGTTALVTLASSSALGFDPSLQFLQLLSALDIAWAGAALMVGTYRASTRPWALVAGAILGVICVWSIWNYLSNVGFGPSGSWIASGPDLMRYVIPFDVMAAVVAIGVFLLGVRSQLREIEQPSAQS
ncbi:MAG: hypothetical protein M3132_08800 [Actinomycetia bacterium]|nr:hypothetical protein [Actinomycetes bacterium]